MLVYKLNNRKRQELLAYENRALIPWDENSALVYGTHPLTEGEVQTGRDWPRREGVRTGIQVTRPHGPTMPG